MRLTPPAVSFQYAATAGAILAITVLLAGCDSETVDDVASDEEESWSIGDWFSFGDDEDEGGGDSQQADGEEGTESEDEEESWSIGDWFSFGDDEDEEKDGNGGESEKEDGEEDSGDEEDGEQYAMPDSCASVGAQDIAGGLAPQGTTVAEDSGGIDGGSDAEQLSCVWSGSGGESFALVFTKNADPSARLDVAQAGEDEMNWEVDVDVNIDNYRTAQADSLGGEIDYVATVEGSTKSLHLSLPENFYVSAIAVATEAGKKDLEDAVIQAAENVEG